MRFPNACGVEQNKYNQINRKGGIRTDTTGKTCLSPPHTPVLARPTALSAVVSSVVLALALASRTKWECGVGPVNRGGGYDVSYWVRDVSLRKTELLLWAGTSGQ